MRVLMVDGATRVCGDSGHSAGSPSSGNSPVREPYIGPETEAENARHPSSQTPLQLCKCRPPSKTSTQEMGPVKNPLCQGCHRSEINSQRPEAVVPSFCGAGSGTASNGNSDVSSRAILVTESQ